MGLFLKGVRSVAASITVVCALVVCAEAGAQTQRQSSPASQKLATEDAVPAILAAFDKYEVVALPEAHGQKDLDDFILLLLRNPEFPGRVNDIAVECGNSLYQPILDRYVAGEDVPFTEVQKVWRNTTQEMCGMSGFFEQFFPLVRAINQKLPSGKRLRVLAGDPPINWDLVKGPQDFTQFLSNRDVSIASVMGKEVFSKHRKALMLFGTFHLLHVGPASAVSIYEKDYPNLTFVINPLDVFSNFSDSVQSGILATWPIPSLAWAKGTWLGALDLSHFLPRPMILDKDCKVHNEFPKDLQGAMSDLVDAFLYLGPQDLTLKEHVPADIALDADYMKELDRRAQLQLRGGPIRTLNERDHRL